jgi:tetratricopeptide (TPR) repeat protein
MNRLTKNILSSVLAAIALFGNLSCSRRPTGFRVAASESSPVSSGTTENEPKTSMVAVRFLEDRVAKDPDDLIAQNKLAAYYLQLHRETDDVKYLKLSLAAAQASLNVLPADQNLGGLTALALAEFETHNFVAAGQHARELTEYKPQSSFGFQLLGDASLELGDYGEAADAYRQMERINRDSVATETRLAHFALLRGDVALARRRYERALLLATQESLPSAETIAWCNWQLGEVEFGAGNLRAAEDHYQHALQAFADYPHALGSLARLRAAQGDLDGAIALYEKLVHGRSDPVDAAALGDVYELAGRRQEAAQQFATVERISQQDQLNTALYNRHLVMFWADHDRNLTEAYMRAKQEYNIRRDVFAADALAWSAFKAGRLSEARTAMKAALRLGTQEAKFFYHAGMIERAAGDLAAAQADLRKSLDLNPHFDPRQSAVAQKALDQ